MSECLRANALEGLQGARGLFEEILAAADDGVGFADAVQGDRDAAGIGERRLFDAALIVPVAVGQDFREQSDGRRVAEDFGGIGTEQGFAAAEKDMDRAQPGAHVAEGGLVLVDGRGVVLALVLPDVAVHALGIAQIGHQEADVGGTATVRPASARDGAQAVVGGSIGAPVGVSHSETLKPRGH